QPHHTTTPPPTPPLPPAPRPPPAPPHLETQFIHINKRARSYIKRGEAVLVIEAKEFAGGRIKENTTGIPYDHDYLVRELGKGVPSACYDLFRHKGFVNAGLDNDTARIAIERLDKWFETEYFEPYRDTERILVTGDFCGTAEWVSQFKELADRINKKITILHFPPGITRWDGIEHRFYSFISKDQDQRLICGAVIINLIGAGNDTGLSVECVTDTGKKSTGVAESNDFAADADTVWYHGEWDYTVLPKRRHVETGKKAELLQAEKAEEEDKSPLYQESTDIITQAALL
ncbi:MAG: hypothetical protein LBD96_09520, partial [Treponema sp.]|nr:hypothetical protein [Treponema sp.]